jgi:hypothetical protein
MDNSGHPLGTRPGRAFYRPPYGRGGTSDVDRINFDDSLCRIDTCERVLNPSALILIAISAPNAISSRARRSRSAISVASQVRASVGGVP